MTRLKTLHAKGTWFLAMALAACVACCLSLPAQAQAEELVAATGAELATQATNYTLGSTVSGTVTSNNDVIYAFTIPTGGADVNISMRNTTATQSTGQYEFYGSIKNSSGTEVWYSGYLDYGESKYEANQFLAAGTYTMTIHEYQSYWTAYKDSYSFSIGKVAQSVKLGSKSGSIKLADTKEVTFTLTGSSEYAKKNMKIARNTQPKVASASLQIGENGVGTLKVTAKAMGKTVISVSLAGAKTVKYTAYVKKGEAYIAKGATLKLTKPLGLKKVTFANQTSKSKKVAATTKAGKVTAKKQGRASIIGKSGKVKYFYNVVVTDYAKLAKRAYNLIEEYIPNPDRLKVNYAYKGTCNTAISGYKRVPIVYIDYSYGNETGGWSRGKIISWFDDALDAQYKSVSTPNSVIGKKKITIK